MVDTPAFARSPEPAWLPPGVARDRATERPFFTFLFKIASRCNLDCSYCYVYSGPDQSWRQRPRFMDNRIASQASDAITEHAAKHGVEEIAVVFHGGEPLLAGPSRIDDYCRIVKSRVPANVEFGVQTNATLLKPKVLDVLAAHDVKVGISLDGTESTNDLNRRFRNGRGSYSRVMKSLDLLHSRPQWSRLLGGFLAVIDIRHDPREVYEGLVSLGAKSLDLLLPDCHHDAPPPRPLDVNSQTAYGRWLSQFFDCWLDGNSQFELRYFEEIIALLLGGFSTLEAIGAKSVDLIVIESDGDIEAVDTLKMVGRHVTDLHLNVMRNSFDDAMAHPAVYSRMLGYEALCDTCKACPELESCGGGYVPHRYGRENGFLNPSVYCEDLKFLFSHIRQKIAPHLVSARQEDSRNERSSARLP